MSWILLTIVLASPSSPWSAYTAQLETDGSVRLARRCGGVSTPVPGLPAGVFWQRFQAREGSLTAAAGGGGVIEVDGELPRLVVRADFHLFAYQGLLTPASGLGSVGPKGFTPLLASDDDRYEIRAGGVALATSGSHLGCVLHGRDREEIWILDLRGSAPVGHRVRLEAATTEMAEIERGTLTLTQDAPFFAAGTEVGIMVYRVNLLGSAPAGDLEPEPVAGPFQHVDRFFAGAPGGVAFLAGRASDQLDVLVVRNAGPAVNVTAEPGPLLRHRPDDPRLALSADGLTVAYDRDLGGEPETYLHEVARPGLGQAFQVTADARFNPYIDQESLIFFDASGRLVFAGGHDSVTTDLYGVTPSNPEAPINLTRTGSSLHSPFLTKGTLALSGMWLAAGGLAYFSAQGFPGQTGSEPQLAAVDLATGDLRHLDALLRLPRGFVQTSSGLIFTATMPDGKQGVFAAVDGELRLVGLVTPSAEPRVLLALRDRALVAIPGTGIVSVGGGESQLLAAHALGTAGADLDTSERYVVFSRDDAAGVQVWLRDLWANQEEAVASVEAGAQLLALAEDEPLLLRGDANFDGAVDVSDPISTLFALFLGEPSVLCEDGADADDDGRITLTDAVRTLDYLFRLGATLPEPTGRAGIDPTADQLGCGG